jgi:hypothetical protein
MNRLARMTVATILAFLCALSGSAGGAQSPTGQALSRTDVRELIGKMQHIVEQHYVLPDRRLTIAKALQQGLRSGHYDVADANVLTARLNEDLLTASHDHHLNIRFDPNEAGRVGARQGDEVRSGPEWERDAQMRNHGIITMRMIPGNIRYIAYDNFVWTGPKSAAAIDTAMDFLRDGDAAILDLRFNGGGSPQAVEYLASYFLPAGRPLARFELEGRRDAESSTTLVTLGGERLVGKPLYVIIGPGTASAAEEFAAHVAGYRFGELVGAKTLGAAYRNDLFGIGRGFVFSVSVGRPVLASTGGDWEGKGITPTIAVDPDKAQDVAIAHALRKLAAVAPPQQRTEYLARADTLWARGFPAPQPLPLTAYVGAFGERTITLQNGQLIYERKGGIRSPLVPISSNRFGLDEDPFTHVLFVVNGSAVTSFDLIRTDGTRSTVMRTE